MLIFRMPAPTRLVTWALIPVLAALLPIGLGGCRKVSSKKESQTAADNRDSDAKQYLSSVTGLLTRDVDADTYITAINQLNKFVDRRPDDIADLRGENRELITRVLGAGAIAQASNKRFNDSDMEYLRNSFFVRGAVRRLAESTRTPLEQANRLFTWTMRQVSLVPADWYPAVPPAEMLVRGYGSDRERLWLFMEVLRQSGLQGAVIAVTTKEKPDDLIPWLAAVFVEGKAYAFDSLSGLPVMNADGSAATLDQIAADPALATRLYDKGAPTVVDVASIDRYALLLGLEAEMFAPRMAFLESQLAGDERATLTINFDETVKQANACLEGVPNNLGVQVWQYPEEISRAYLASRTARSEEETKHRRPFERWLSTQFSIRVSSLQGDLQESIRQFVERDMSPTEAVVFEIGLKPLELPMDEKRAAISHILGSTKYFAGLTQFEAHPDKLKNATDWLSRYVEKASNWKLTPADIIDVPLLGLELLGVDSDHFVPLQLRIYENLSEEGKAAAKKASEEEKEAKIVPPILAEANPTADIPMPLDAKELFALGRDINEVLARPDLVTPNSADTDLAGQTSKPLTMMLSETIADDDTMAIGWRNRLAFDIAFRPAIVPAESPWLTGGISTLAEAYARMGEKTKAIELLRQSWPCLAPIQIASLHARANALENGTE